MSRPEARVGVEEFGPVAAFYDELMREVPYRMWAAYYLLLLSTLEERPKTALDVCCGTGVMAELLHDEGIRVEGFDLSEPMVRQARFKARDKGLDLRYEVADAAEFEMGRTYEGAYSFFDSLNYIVEPERLQSALNRVAAHLFPGASFVFDVNTAYAFETDLFTQRKLSPSARVRYDWQGRWDPASRIIEVDMRFWHEGREIFERHVQRAYSDEELRAMLELAGFERIVAYHSYTLDRPRATSDRLHYVCLRSSP